MADVVSPRWWSLDQLARLAELRDYGAWLGYWCSNDQGQPAQFGCAMPRATAPGTVDVEHGPLRESCGVGQLHATRDPVAWPGSRVWVVALLGDVRSDGDSKSWALRREILGEVYPTDCGDDGRLRMTCLRSWSTGAHLTGADLTGADLTGADLTGADLTGAHLTGANLRGADLTGAHLKGAHLKGAHLKGAHLKGAHLTGAHLKGANLRGADLTGADLTGAHLTGADLTGAHLKGAWWSTYRKPPAGWRRNGIGQLEVGS